MSKVNHAARAHALLSPSAAKRWLNCNQSARLTDMMQDKSSSFAQEGTLAHELCEVKLREWLGILTKPQATKAHKAIKANPLYNEEMEEYTDDYVGYVQQKYNEVLAHTPDAIISIEERVHFEEYVQEGNGSCDALIVGDNKLVVIDFKYGQGIPVSPEKNEQAMLYGLGAILNYEMEYGLEKVELCIHQPRIGNVSEWETTTETIKVWAEFVVKPRAKLAYEGKGSLTSGDWCKFCKIAGTCRARAEEAMQDFADMQECGPELTNEEMGEFLPKFKKISDWMKALEDTAFAKAMAGETIQGHKLVEGRSIRKYTNEEAILERLEKLNIEKSEVTETKLLALTKLEKAIGKTIVATELSEFIEKPAGKPTLVAADDKRPEIKVEENLINEMFDALDGEEL